MIHYMIRWLSMAWGAFLPHLISGPPTRCQAVYRCFWFRNWGLSQATSGNPRSSASRHKAACRLRRQAIYTRSTWRSSRR